MALQDTLNELKSFDINDLDLENIGSWPMVVKAIVWVLVFGLCLGGGIYYHIIPMTQELQQAREQEQALKKTFEQKAFKAANLEVLRKQMAEMEETFGALLSQLPADTEVPGLLEDITEKAINNGLEISKIQLQPEKTQEFFIELPISIEVKGTYHDIAGFISGIAGLPRIVTLHNFSITSGKQDPSQLSMSITAKTYRYRDPEAAS